MKRFLLVLALFTLSLSAFGQTYTAEAKFVCGRADSTVTDAFAFAPGTYYTSINVGNPNDEKIDTYKKIFSVALLRQKAGKVTQSIAWSLGPRESMQVDCSDIYGYLGVAPGTFIDGFVYFLGGPIRYTVTGVYTLTDGSRAVSQDVEEVTVTRQ
ncbi:MAG TPA: hypothetical protein VGQ36_27920 [Thermoanaerobaculia bacterium]|jgi:hypothetical protein|nr:hypothetical protein [Thermoanaerobaculia bacterium]